MPFVSEKQRRWMWANKPALAQEWADKYGSTPTKKDSKMPKGRSTGRLKDPGKPGSMKSIIYASGGGRRALLQWRAEKSANATGAKANKSVAKTGGSAAKAVVAGLRSRSKKTTAVREFAVAQHAAKTAQMTASKKKVRKQVAAMKPQAKQKQAAFMKQWKALGQD